MTAWLPDLDEMITHIGEGGDFLIVNDESGNGIGLVLSDGNRESDGLMLPSAEGVPMPSRGYALLALATMVVKWEAMNR